MTDVAENEWARVLATSGHRPYPQPAGRWRMRQRWNDLLFAHWPVAPADLAGLIPPGLELDTFDGFAWVGVVPFFMDQVQNRVSGERTISIPTTKAFAELNLRTYVRSPRSGKRGVFFFSLDCQSPLAVFGARVLFHLPYFVARMNRDDTAEGTAYRSRRLLTSHLARFDATYKSVLPPHPQGRPDTLEYFLTERYCLFTSSRGRILRGDIHHLPWPLQPAEAEVRRNEIPAVHGVPPPDRPLLLHYAQALEVFIWPLCLDTK